MSPTEFRDGDDLFRRFFGDQFDRRTAHAARPLRQRGLGPAWSSASDGYILTNNHVIDGADDIQRGLYRRPDADGEAGWLGQAERSGAAEGRTRPICTPLTLGNSDAVEVGDVVLAVGNPLGVGQTVTMGIISAKGRSTGGVGDGSYEDFLQTDAPINHGNSGGALVNTKGELVGINSQIVSSTGEQHRHRLRDSGQHGATRHGRASSGRHGAPRAARRHGAAGHVGHGRQPRPEGGRRRHRQRRSSRAARRTGRA